jgi:hypothetical protein
MRQALFRKTTIGPDESTASSAIASTVVLVDEDNDEETPIISNPFKRGARNKLEEDILYSINKDCRCGSACLKKMMTSVQFSLISHLKILFLISIIYVKASTATIAQQRYSKKFVCKFIKKVLTRYSSRKK